MSSDPIPYTAPLVHDCAFQLLKQEQPGKVLDVPAGQGAFAKKLEAEKFEVWYGDIQADPHLLTNKKLVILDLNVGLPYKSEFFDYVACLEGIEHLENPHLLVHEINRVLKVGGKCILSTPNILSMKSRLSYLFYGYPNYFHLMIDTDPTTGAEKKIDHINPVTILELRYILSQNGFEIEQIDTNRLLGKRSFLFYLLKMVMSSRGKRSARDSARARVRQLLFSDPVMFGEILVLKARKISSL
ncbi:MAG: class I SAM-dependent methyltransferase [Nitrospira sp.]|nr:class I SAM-dependent methyltransferase [Nitrospira sp.]